MVASASGVSCFSTVRGFADSRRMCWQSTQGSQNVFLSRGLPCLRRCILQCDSSSRTLRRAGCQPQSSLRGTALAVAPDVLRDRRTQSRIRRLTIGPQHLMDAVSDEAENGARLCSQSWRSVPSNTGSPVLKIGEDNRVLVRPVWRGVKRAVACDYCGATSRMAVAAA